MNQDQNINTESTQISEVSLIDLWQILVRYFYVVLITTLVPLISVFVYIYAFPFGDAANRYLLMILAVVFGILTGVILIFLINAIKATNK